MVLPMTYNHSELFSLDTILWAKQVNFTLRATNFKQDMRRNIQRKIQTIYITKTKFNWLNNEGI